MAINNTIANSLELTNEELKIVTGGDGFGGFGVGGFGSPFGFCGFGCW